MISLDSLASSLKPESTVLLFGAGSSMPSGAPSSRKLVESLATAFKVDASDLDLREMSTLIETRHSRSQLIDTLRPMFADLRPTGGLLTLPRFRWKSLFTTNYDQLIEKAYERANSPMTVFSSNFDFRRHDAPDATKLHKLHGTVEHDVADGHRSRWIITEQDYDLTDEFRESLFDSFRNDLASANLVIIGHSLADPDIKAIVTRALAIRQKASNPGGIYMLMYSGSPEKAAVFESRGIKVAVGGIDDFFAALTAAGPALSVVHTDTGNPLDVAVVLQPLTIDVGHSRQWQTSKIADMFNGWPASYADIDAGLTFKRSVVEACEAQFRSGGKPSVLLLGASGVGKTTAGRQLLTRCATDGYHCWEHKSDHPLMPDRWIAVAQKLQRDGVKGLLLVDDGDEHLHELNSLFDGLSSKGLTSLGVVITASRNQWNPRIKSPTLLAGCETYVLEKLDAREITDLLRLVESNTTISALVESSFLGFSPSERRVRLEERFEKDMFVCLKNIFASEAFDDIVLREYASLAPQLQDIYKYVAALEDAGVRVHRQLIIRLLGIPMNTLGSSLENLTDIIHEYTIDEKQGVYGWRGRHPVIMGIIAEFKFAETESYATLFERVIDALMPTLDIEIRTLIALCSGQGGIMRLPDRKVQNRLLGKMISVAPGERVPRHRLIRNLIDMNEFESAEAEIRVFTKDFREDGPVHRYKVLLLVARAKNSPGLMEEDRLVILNRAKDLAIAGIRKYRDNKHMLYTYCEVGIGIYKRSGDLSVFADAIRETKAAEKVLGDPEVSRRIDDFERRVIGQTNMSLAK